MTRKYAVVTAFSNFAHTYAIPLDELQNLNTEVPLDIEWALDCVTCNEVKEFSQTHLGEQLIPYVEVLTEDEILKRFDRENDYLASWEREQKLNWINNWRETMYDEDPKQMKLF